MSHDQVGKQLRDRLQWLLSHRKRAFEQSEGLRQALILGWSQNPTFDRYRFEEFRAEFRQFDRLIAQQEARIRAHRTRKRTPPKPQQSRPKTPSSAVNSPERYLDGSTIRWRDMRASDPEDAWAMSCWNASTSFSPSFGIGLTDDDDYYKDATRWYRVPAALNWPHGRIRPHVHRWNEGKPGRDSRI